MCWYKYTPELISGGATIVAAVLAVTGGIWGFFRQKEYELVQKRYLEEGLDVVISTAVNSLNTFHHNWARCLELLKSFRDVDTIKPEEFEVGFLQLPADRFALTANYRVNQIIDSPVVWQAFQLLISFAQYACSVARYEIPAALKLKITTNVLPASREQMVDEAMKVLEDLDAKSHRFHLFISLLQDISVLLKEQKFALKDIRALRKHPVVIDALVKLEKEYGSDLRTA